MRMANRRRLSAQSPGEFQVDLVQYHHLRQILVCLNMPVVQQPEAYIGNVTALLDENGKVKNEGTVGLLTIIRRCVCRILIKRYQG